MHKYAWRVSIDNLKNHLTNLVQNDSPNAQRFRMCQMQKIKTNMTTFYPIRGTFQMTSPQHLLSKYEEVTVCCELQDIQFRLKRSD